MGDAVPVVCGYCGAELDGLGSDHTCREAIEVAAFVATGNADVFIDGANRTDDRPQRARGRNGGET